VGFRTGKHDGDAMMKNTTMNTTNADMDFSTVLHDNPKANMDMVYCALTSSTLSRSKIGMSMFTDTDNAVLMNYHSQVISIMESMRLFSDDRESLFRSQQYSPKYYDNWLKTYIIIHGEMYAIRWLESNGRGFDDIMDAMICERGEDEVWCSSYRVAGFLYSRFIRLDLPKMSMIYHELPLFIHDLAQGLPYEFALESMELRAVSGR
jgi:hypothetical protein